MIEAAVCSTRGVAKAVNEDHAYLSGAAVGDGMVSSELDFPACFAVFDGVSQGGRGCEASAVAAAVMSEAQALEGMALWSPEGLAEVLVHAHRGILAYADENARGSVAATTVAGIGIASDGALLVFNAGDSRVYRWRDGVMAKLSSDHTLDRELAEIAERHGYEVVDGQTHVITRALGMPNYETEPAEIVSGGWCLEGDVFLVCSDGVTDVVSDEQIASILSQDVTARAKARTLVDFAIHRGTLDNTTAVIVQVR